MRLKNIVRKLFKKNMKVICGCSVPDLTVGKEHEVLKVIQHDFDWVCFEVIDDNGEKRVINRDRFKY